MLFLWPLGVPLLYGSLLALSAGALKARRPTRISRACHFLHGEYRPSYYYWELLDLLRRLVFTGCCGRARTPLVCRAPAE